MADENNKYKEVTYYGVLVTHSNVSWYLLMDRPVDRESWMSDHERMFLACQPFGHPEHIIVSGYTLRKAKGKIQIEKSEEEKEEPKEVEETHHPDIIEWLNAKAEV